MRRFLGRGTRLIDARARRVIPGITDSHTHIVSGGFQLDHLNLRDVRDRNQFVNAVGVRARVKRPGEWIVGGRWSVESWARPETPDKSWIDALTPDVPVFLNRMDGHSALVNSAALRAAGIDANGPPDPKGGEIVRDPHTGEPTGILTESAMGLASGRIPEPSPNERYQALLRAMRYANTLGITSVHDMCELADLETFRRAQREASQSVRITAYLSVDDWTAYVDRIAAFDLNSDMVRLAGLKGYMDGSMGSRTAYMHDAYSDASAGALHPRGMLTPMADPPESFQTVVAVADARGLQLAVHAIGDDANHLLLDVYASAIERNGRRDARHRDEHAQHLIVSDIPRFAQLGVVASMQPFHKADDGRYAEIAIGRDRLPGSYAFRQLVDNGALLIFGSDWPVVTLNPFAGIAAAVTARTLAGDVWLPSHSLTRAEALRAYTAAPARAIHMENKLGTIEVGKLADIVVLADDPFAVPDDGLADVRVAITMIGGRIVYESE